jgi:hypothetical protein
LRGGWRAETRTNTDPLGPKRRWRVVGGLALLARWRRGTDGMDETDWPGVFLCRKTGVSMRKMSVGKKVDKYATGR